MPIPTINPIVVAPSPTPFKADDSVDHAAIERNVQKWLKTPLSGFVLNSENGEEEFLSVAERLEIVRTVNKARNGEKFIVGGVDSSSVTQSIKTAGDLVEAGAEMIRIRIPRLTENVTGYFEQVVPRVPAPVMIIHQMAPGMFAGGAAPVGAQPEVIGDMIDLDNVFGYIASGNVRFEARVRNFVTSKKPFWLGNGLLLLAMSAIGANGACLMFGNVAPVECHQIISSVMNGDLATAQEVQTRIIEADQQILDRGPAGIKAALDLLGYDGGSPRSPNLPSSSEEREIIRAAMKQARLI
ncbi:MAG TPA: dihydrodipicolinate synthase family protein [Dehalococcoidia bacterium]|jgi:4-hydroxy-2-oxoglutarate aldolase|nr:dihydrodipicolinate synthase family protein [Dehalococcoidia bacterium]MDP7262305.1 dihydrodipicolinate synthase family protein [Dehalococcoidia bacterium]MDP7484458.1 dihydrodipicolinate synthase family protein [Dehalococcoidia bacterium]HJP27312.1 dihydrodipicolinate synthase family protein [Dehalococcoidia bacterium]|tara:strand:- start:4124 stop:5017 length:894 start_codon:yes stop_codon:yes gene_type:complete